MNALKIYYMQVDFIEKMPEYDTVLYQNKKMKTDELYFISISDERISLEEAITHELASIKDWRKKAWVTLNDGDTEILRYENYEIAITGMECIIRPVTE